MKMFEGKKALTSRISKLSGECNQIIRRFSPSIQLTSGGKKQKNWSWWQKIDFLSCRSWGERISAPWRKCWEDAPPRSL